MKQALAFYSVLAGLLAIGAQAEDHDPNTDWLCKARLGIFMHFLPSNPETLDLVKDFDTAAVGKQLSEIGADYFVITLGQNSGYFISPNAAYDKQTGYTAGERCAVRDLPLDLRRELKVRNIRLMLYFDQIPRSRWLKGSQWHALTYLGSNWMKRDIRYPAERWITWIKAVKEHEGAVTIDMGPNYNRAAGPIGAFSDEQFRQAKVIGSSLQSRLVIPADKMIIR